MAAILGLVRKAIHGVAEGESTLCIQDILSSGCGQDIGLAIHTVNPPSQNALFTVGLKLWLVEVVWGPPPHYMFYVISCVLAFLLANLPQGTLTTNVPTFVSMAASPAFESVRG